MGVPALFRWLTTKYPKLTERAVEERAREVNHVVLPVDTSKPNPNGFETDNLYLDMNGIIHPCTHPEDKVRTAASYALVVNADTADTAPHANTHTLRARARIAGAGDGGGDVYRDHEVHRPTLRHRAASSRPVHGHRCVSLVRGCGRLGVWLTWQPWRIRCVRQPVGTDGVAPRAKMNQQRSRRFRAAQEAQDKEASREEALNAHAERTSTCCMAWCPGPVTHRGVRTHGRSWALWAEGCAGAGTGQAVPDAITSAGKRPFDSNCITPGTLTPSCPASFQAGLTLTDPREPGWPREPWLPPSLAQARRS